MTEKFDYIISLGENCQTAITLRSLGLRKYAFPFDWHGVRNFEIAGNGGFAKKIDLICNNFANFFEESNYEEFFETWETAHRLIVNNKTGLQFLHEFPKDQSIHDYFPKFTKKYQNRINRLYKILQSNKIILFVFIEFFATLSNEEIINSCTTLITAFPHSHLHFLIIKNTADLKKWQIEEKELTPEISLFYINNDFSNDVVKGNGNIGNKGLYRKIIADFSYTQFVDCTFYNAIFQFEEQAKKDFDYLGWKVNEVIPKLLREINNKIPPVITYQNTWEKEFIRKNFADFNLNRCNNDICILLHGLDKISALNAQKIISRLNLLLKSAYQDIDIFSKTEQQEIWDVQKRHNECLALGDELFYNYGYYLPVNHFEDTVFIKKLNIDLLPKNILPKLKGTDFADIGAYVGDSACVLEELSPQNIYAFEANEKNCKLMSKTLALNNLKNVTPLNYALGAKNGKAYIKDNGACSVIQDNISLKKTKMLTLDTFMEDHPEINLSLIKVDIEGEEQNFLKGAENTLRKFRPVLLLSIYHNLNDFLSLKIKLEDLNLGYKFKISTPTYGCIVCETNLIAYCEDI